MPETRKLAAILAADVAGYSKLAGSDEERTLARLRGLRSDLFDPAVAAHHGRIVKRTGDGAIIEFRSVVDAVRCAIEVQNGMVRNRGLKMTLGDVVITTEGTVGIESQQINLVTTIPIQDNWIKKQEGFLGSLKGQVLQIPVTGTLRQPKLDTRILQNLGKQLAGSAVQGVISQQLEKKLGGSGGTDGLLKQGEGLLQGELGQGLNRLFGPKTPAANPAPTTRPK